MTRGHPSYTAISTTLTDVTNCLAPMGPSTHESEPFFHAIELMHRIRKGQFGLDVWAFKAELRLQSGTQCLDIEVCMPQ
jgi:hypothetical protein